MNRRLSMLFVATAFVAIIGMTQAYAASDKACPLCETTDLYENIRDLREIDVPVRVWIERNLYSYGSDIQVRGAVANLKDMPVTLKITGPQNNVVGIQQIEVSEDKTFQTTLKAVGSLWNSEGVYTIRVQYGSYETNDKVTFELVGAPGTPIECDENQITVMGEGDKYCITHEISGAVVKNARVSSSAYSILLQLNTKTDGSLLLSIPRYILDAKSSTGDTPFIVTIDDESAVDYYEPYSDDQSRTLVILFPEYTEQIEIIGTYAIPEFGTLVMIILTIAIASIVAISARTKFNVLFKY
ncbi:PEFG-CTERM sorting domain-containing protein [Candidatus Nitrosotenuis chungbukensis]|uniref:PEFG-CTERM sorting domain-containing protein n=2 Tax=Candidatus Nitrosotenuis chungbukensis TaxID=1353246 RepID=UPI0009DE8D2C|nr:PEFG-CTERM sorting domain-containing protein [Candidatus Nitrosotenuis chungbukensis]